MKEVKILKTNKKHNWMEYRFVNINYNHNYFISIFKDKKKKWAEGYFEMPKKIDRFGNYLSYEIVDDFEKIIKFIEEKLKIKIKIIEDDLIII